MPAVSGSDSRLSTPPTSLTTPREVLPQPQISMEWYNRMVGATNHFIAETTAQLRAVEASRDAYVTNVEQVQAVLAEYWRHKEHLVARLLEEQRRGRAVWSELQAANGSAGEYLNGAFAHQLEMVERTRAALAANDTDWLAEMGCMPIGLRNAWRGALGKEPVHA